VITISHYTVLVIGDDVDEQLAPYDENISVDPYKQYADSDDIERFEHMFCEQHKRDPENDEELVAWLNGRHRGDDGAPNTSGLKPRQLAELGVYLIDETGIYSWNIYNPQSKWDWYTIGGRWRGYFMTRKWSSPTEAWNTIHDEAIARGLENGEAIREADHYAGAQGVRPAELGESGAFDNEALHDADQLLKGDVDVEGMRSYAAERAAQWWDRMDQVCAELPEAKPWSTFVEKLTIVEQKLKIGEIAKTSLTIDKVREQYHAQPRVAALKSHDDALYARVRELRDSDPEMAEKLNHEVLGSFMGDRVDEYQLGREEYIQRARDSALAPYAYVKNGKWQAPGKMGWFASSSESDSERRRWNREFCEMFDRLPADTPLTLVDCHI
jgi:hypothetical protein